MFPSLFSYVIGMLINVEPAISKEGQLLVIRSGWRAYLFTLGAVSRKVTIDPVLRVVHLSGRRFWLFTWARRIEYDWIQQISYGYWSMGGQIPLSEGTQKELFTVSLDLKNNTQVLICRFFGGGDFYNNTIMPDWWYYGDQWVSEAARGSQEEHSSALVNLLQNLIGVPVVNQMP